jgi:hypothetical protein
MASPTERVILKAIAGLDEHQKFRPEPPADIKDYELWGKEFMKRLVSLRLVFVTVSNADGILLITGKLRTTRCDRG